MRAWRREGGGGERYKRKMGNEGKRGKKGIRSMGGQ